MFGCSIGSTKHDQGSWKIMDSSLSKKGTGMAGQLVLKGIFVITALAALVHQVSQVWTPCTTLKLFV